MPYEIRLTRQADRQLDRLPRNVLPRVEAAIEALATDPYPPGCQAIRGPLPLHRIRVGDYRVRNDVLEVLIVLVGHRRDVYRGLRDLSD